MSSRHMTADVALAVRHCSGPFWPDAAPAWEVGVADLVRVAADALADRLRTAPDGLSALSVQLDELVRAPDLIRPAWRPSVAQAVRAGWSRSDENVSLATVGLVLDFIESVGPFDWCLQFANPARMRINPIVLPPTTSLEVRWSRPLLSMRSSLAEVELELRGAERKLVHCMVADRSHLGVMQDVGGLAVLRDSEGGGFLPWANGELDVEVAGDRGQSDVATAVKAGLEILSAHVPAYAQWCPPVLQCIIPVTGGGKHLSASSRDAPGVVLLSTGMDPITAAELLVHESAHQYIHFAGRLGSLTTGGDDRLYYSPLARRSRPLDRVVVACHAAANIAAMYDVLRMRAGSDAGVEPAYERAVANYRTLVGHLHGNDHVAEIGLAACRPIAEWLAGRWI